MIMVKSVFSLNNLNKLYANLQVFKKELIIITSYICASFADNNNFVLMQHQKLLNYHTKLPLNKRQTTKPKHIQWLT